MTILNVFQKLRALQEYIKECGMAASQLALPAPKLLMLPVTSTMDSKEEILFSHLVTEPEISDVSRDLFESGFYNQAVQEAFKALDKYIQKKAKKHDISGAKLAQQVFSEKNPLLVWSDRTKTSERDEQKGYQFLYDGAFTGIRNPCSHEIEWINDHTVALDVILLAQHLLRKAKEAKLNQI